MTSFFSSTSLSEISSEIETNFLEAINEIDAFCKDNKWISDIKIFTTKFSKETVLEWKTKGSFEIEEQLSKIKSWIDQIKTSIDLKMITKNRLLKINCKPIETILIPKLDSIFTETCECILMEIKNDLTTFVRTISNAIEVYLFFIFYI